MKYRVAVDITVSHHIDVEAKDEDEAMREAYLEGLPGLRFIDGTFPDYDEGDFEVLEVTPLEDQ